MLFSEVLKRINGNSGEVIAEFYDTQEKTQITVYGNGEIVTYNNDFKKPYSKLLTEDDIDEVISLQDRFELTFLNV